MCLYVLLIEQKRQTSLFHSLTRYSNSHSNRGREGHTHSLSRAEPARPSVFTVLKELCTAARSTVQWCSRHDEQQQKGMEGGSGNYDQQEEVPPKYVFFKQAQHTSQQLFGFPFHCLLGGCLLDITLRTCFSSCPLCTTCSQQCVKEQKNLRS